MSRDYTFEKFCYKEKQGIDWGVMAIIGVKGVLFLEGMNLEYVCKLLEVGP